MSAVHRYVATCPKAVEHLLALEVGASGAADVREGSAAVVFSGPLEVAYRVCLWSRVASRVLLVLAEFGAATAEELYAGVAAVPWQDHVSPTGTIAVDASGRTEGLVNSRFAAQKVKDAIADRLRERTGTRPSVDLRTPDVRVNVRLHREQATVSLDLSGQPLHQRGYREPGAQVAAPLKENLAAAVLLRAGWPDIAEGGGSLVDPLCGSGTLLVEGALIAADQAPGLLRPSWGFVRWLGHDEQAWAALLAAADERAEAGRERVPLICGRDADPQAVALAAQCANRAGLRGLVLTEVGDLATLKAPSGAKPGLVVTNPPYGIRLGDARELEPLYALLGERLQAEFDGWQAAVLTADDALARAIGLRSEAAHTLYNGPVKTRLYRFSVSPAAARAEVRRAPVARSAGAEMFANRLRKNARHLGKWARREGVTCYRVYDADLPEYSVAVDLYQGAGGDAGRRFAHVAEYAPPPEVDPARAEARLREATEVVSEVLEVLPENVAVKVRRRQRGTSQYERLDERGTFVEVAEGGLRFLVNLFDYLDTGLFLDHRPVRALVRSLASGKRVANLFCYTGSASVYAAAGGAREVTSVDLSATYIGWAKRNLALNGFTDSHAFRFVRADASEWVARERARVETGEAAPYGLVFLDPPTFSTSKGMGERTFDVQRDHVPLIRDTASLLAPEGTLVFSTNARRFTLDRASLSGLHVEDVSAATIPPDFARTPSIHRCFVVRRAGSS